MKNDRSFVQSLSRGLTLLSLVAESPSSLSLTELSQQANLSKGTVQRLTYTLERLELLDRDQESKKFRLGPQITAIALSVLRNLDVHKVALPYMRDTAADTGETVGMAILSGSDVMFVDFVRTGNIVGIDLKIGDRVPAHCASSGKAILAFLPESLLENILQKTQWTRFTPHTITDRKDLYRELERVRIQGFSTNREQINLGVMGVAAPVRNVIGDVIAAVNIAVPTFRTSRKELETFYARKVMELADKISFAMGHRKDFLEGKEGENH